MAALTSFLPSFGSSGSGRPSDLTRPSYVRRAQHSGSWYSSSSQTLRASFDKWLEAAKPKFEVPATSVLGVISPHAGYRFSGPTAAYGFAALSAALKEQPAIKRIFVLGPSHKFSLSGIAVSGASACETPIADLAVDTEAIRSIDAALSKAKLCRYLSEAEDENEHSIEMQLPFLAHAINISGRDTTDVSIVPIMVGNMRASKDSIDAVAHALLPFAASHDSLFVISSDFCHYGSRFDYDPFADPKSRESRPICECIRSLDHEAMGIIERCDHKGFEKYLRETDNTICGRNPISLFLRTIELFNASSSSSSTAGERARGDGVSGGSAPTAGSGASSTITSASAGASGGSIGVRFLHYSQSSAIQDDPDDSSVSYASAVVSFQ